MFSIHFKDANVGTSPLNTFHSAIDDIIASRRLKYNDLQQQKINRQKVKIVSSGVHLNLPMMLPKELQWQT